MVAHLEPEGRAVSHRPIREWPFALGPSVPRGQPKLPCGSLMARVSVLAAQLHACQCQCHWQWPDLSLTRSGPGPGPLPGGPPGRHGPTRTRSPASHWQPPKSPVPGYPRAFSRSWPNQEIVGPWIPLSRPSRRGFKFPKSRSYRDPPAKNFQSLSPPSRSLALGIRGEILGVKSPIWPWSRPNRDRQA